MLEAKDAKTEQFRQCLSRVDGIVETDRADSGLTTLSYQSVTRPERHIWVDTDLAGEPVLDLEDWNQEETWDNSVAHFTSADIDLLAAIAKAWLTGATVHECDNMGASRADVR